MNGGRPTISVRVTYVWLVLCGLTLLAWALAASRGGQHPTGSTPEAVAVLVLAAVKARLVIREFMEVRSAPRWLRRFTDAWLVGICVTVLVMYLS
jgi:cytochrome c oxidase subunit IV